MHHLNKEFKPLSLGVSLETKKKFHTFNPNNPANFWFYTPQLEYDKAPIKFVPQGAPPDPCSAGAP